MKINHIYCLNKRPWSFVHDPSVLKKNNVFHNQNVITFSTSEMTFANNIIVKLLDNNHIMLSFIDCNSKANKYEFIIKEESVIG